MLHLLKTLASQAVSDARYSRVSDSIHCSYSTGTASDSIDLSFSLRLNKGVGDWPRAADVTYSVVNYIQDEQGDRQQWSKILATRSTDRWDNDVFLPPLSSDPG